MTDTQGREQGTLSSDAISQGSHTEAGGALGRSGQGRVEETW